MFFCRAETPRVAEESESCRHGMRKFMNPLAKMAAAGRTTLSKQAISGEGPGTILRDAETLMEFIGERGLVTGSRQGNQNVLDMGRGS